MWGIVTIITYVVFSITNSYTDTVKRKFSSRVFPQFWRETLSWGAIIFVARHIYGEVRWRHLSVTRTNRSAPLFAELRTHATIKIVLLKDRFMNCTA